MSEEGDFWERRIGLPVAYDEGLLEEPTEWLKGSLSKATGLGAGMGKAVASPRVLQPGGERVTLSEQNPGPTE